MKRALFVHEFRRTRGDLLLLFVGAVGLVAVGSAAMATPVTMLTGTGTVLATVTVAIFIPVVTIALAVDYWRSGYGRGGYLTQSLPMKGSTIYAVRLAYGAAVILVSMFVTLLLAVPPALVAAGRAAPEGVSAIGYLENLMRSAQPPLTPGVFAAAAALVFGSAFCYLSTYYFAASVGSEARFARLGTAAPFVVWFVLYFGLQVAAIASLVIPWGVEFADTEITLVNRDWFAAMLTDTAVNGAPIGVVPVLAVITLVLIWRTAYSWNHKVSLR